MVQAQTELIETHQQRLSIETELATFDCDVPVPNSTLPPTLSDVLAQATALEQEIAALNPTADTGEQNPNLTEEEARVVELEIEHGEALLREQLLLQKLARMEKERREASERIDAVVAKWKKKPDQKPQ